MTVMTTLLYRLWYWNVWPASGSATASGTGGDPGQGPVFIWTLVLDVYLSYVNCTCVKWGREIYKVVFKTPSSRRGVFTYTYARPLVPGVARQK